MPTPLLILYATVTGNAESCAEKIAEFARQRGFEPRVWNVEGFDIKQLANEPAALFSVSTYGEGDPPDQATTFWDELQAYAGSLSNLRYAIYALGDTSYSDFCGFGKKLDSELSTKGAQCIAERADNDLDFEAGLDAWCNAVFDALPGVLTPAGA